MPNYDYTCNPCKLNLWINREINDKEVKPPCPNCAKPMIRRFDGPLVQFNSPGFYSTEGKL